MVKDERETSRAESETELKVTDKRLFTSDGQLRGDVEEEETVAEPAAAEEAVRNEETSGKAEFERQPVEEPTGVDFTMLINAMAEPALLFLGEIAHPSTGQPQVDLERARIQIDMLDLLRVKCRGNLSTQEDGLLDRILYQLRMLFVERSGQQAPELSAAPSRRFSVVLALVLLGCLALIPTTTIAQVDSGVIRLGSPSASSENSEAVEVQESRRGFDHTSFESRLESLWFQRKALLADGRTDDANEQLERIRAFCFEEGVSRLEYLAGALISESKRYLDEGNQQQVYTALEYAEHFDAGRPQVHLARAAAHWEFGGGPVKTGKELFRALEASWSRGLRDLTLAHQMLFVAGLALAGAVIFFSLLMLLRYQVPFRHEVQEWVCGFASGEWGAAAGWAMLGLPLLLWAGAGWAFVYWIVITFRFMRRSERIVATVLLLASTMALPTYNVTIALFGTTADPAVRNTVSAVVGEYDPDRIVKLRQLVDEHPDDPVYHFLLAQLYTNGRYLEEAFEEYRLSIELRPNLVPAFINIGNVFYTTGQYREAVVNYTRALEHEPNSFLAHFNMHLAQSEDFRFTDAEESLSSARAIDPDRVASLLSAGGAVGDRSRVQDATLHMASIWDSAVGGTRTVRFSSDRGASGVSAGALKLVNPISIVCLLGVVACYTMLFAAGGKESARRCIRCGRPFCHHCKSAHDAKEYCSQCLHLFVLGDGLEPGTKQRKLFEVERYEKRWRRLRAGFSIVVPGAGQLLRGRTAQGLLLITCWFAAVIAAQPIALYPVERLIGVDLQTSVFLRAGSVPAVYGAEPLAFIALLVLLPIWLVGNLWQRKRWVT